MPEKPFFAVSGESPDNAVLTFKRVDFDLSREEFDAIAEGVDAVRDAELTTPPPFGRLKAALEAIVELAETKGDEEVIWHIVIDRIKAVRDSGLMARCGMGDLDLLDVVDEGYADETNSMRYLAKGAIERLEPLVAAFEEQPSSRY